MDVPCKQKRSAGDSEQRLVTDVDHILQEAEEIVRERQQRQNQQAGLLDLAAITWTCEVCGCVNPLANVSSCKNCGC